MKRLIDENHEDVTSTSFVSELTDFLENFDFSFSPRIIFLDVFHTKYASLLDIFFLYHKRHFFSGFIRDPLAQPKVSANSFVFCNDPRIL